MEKILPFLIISSLIIFIDFAAYLIGWKGIVHRYIITLAEIGALLAGPWAYAGWGAGNVCCAQDEIDTAAFASPHQLTVITIIVLALAAYGYSKFRKQLATPVMEVAVNVALIAGIVFNIVLSFHIVNKLFVALGTIPIILLGLLMLIKNQQLFISQHTYEKGAPYKRTEVWAWKILLAQPLIKFPLLLLLCLPFLVIVIIFLLLFGQKPDSIIRAFTETYHHNFSQWDYKCDNVECGGHYLCSVAANGHKRLVKPVRYGTRNNGIIICNRQLLVANAFEELLQERMPAVHRSVRKQYNKVGNLIHRYYNIFNNKIISDIVYIIMKPLEWCFLLVLYTFDSKPENRIAMQYLGKTNRAAITPQ
ncbi:hypothetical protein SAMN04488505_11013 [Chitinophaga rupis]|uniref:Uncharacterized protein n=1 Tax=Chitinophaga rupis TaxID=573321 RepID=A0A1H8G2G4_9BACT|nr:DUF6688 family protein [Chitinophaga rupis]SEN38176.1 hypothetical protein SAMN04488505_11013 [Chitinophaga rupis]